MDRIDDETKADERCHLQLVGGRATATADEIDDGLTTEEALDCVEMHLADAVAALQAIRAQGIDARRVFRLQDEINNAHFIAQLIHVGDLVGVKVGAP
jgi:hypothetical protein